MRRTKVSVEGELGELIHAAREELIADLGELERNAPIPDDVIASIARTLDLPVEVVASAFKR